MTFSLILSIDYHRDSTPRTKLLALANENDVYSVDRQQSDGSIKTSDTVDIDIGDLVFKPWCFRFCPRCYTYK